MFAVINSVSGSNYSAFQIKVWDSELGKSRLYAEGFATRIEAKRAADNDPELTRVDSFRVAQERTDGVVRPAKRTALRVPTDMFNSALADSLARYAA